MKETKILILLCLFNYYFVSGVDNVEFYFHNGSSSPQKVLRNRLPCSCQSYTCGCCAGMNIQSYNFSQNGKCCIASFTVHVLKSIC